MQLDPVSDAVSPSPVSEALDQRLEPSLPPQQQAVVLLNPTCTSSSSVTSATPLVVAVDSQSQQTLGFLTVASVDSQGSISPTNQVAILVDNADIPAPALEAAAAAAAAGGGGGSAAVGSAAVVALSTDGASSSLVEIAVSSSPSPVSTVSPTDTTAETSGSLTLSVPSLAVAAAPVTNPPPPPQTPRRPLLVQVKQPGFETRVSLRAGRDTRIYSVTIRALWFSAKFAIKAHNQEQALVGDILLE